MKETKYRINLLTSYAFIKQDLKGVTYNSYNPTKLQRIIDRVQDFLIDHYWFTNSILFITYFNLMFWMWN